MHYGKFSFEPFTWDKTIFNMKQIFFSNDPLLPKIMNILLCKFGKKDGVHQGLNTANDFDLVVALRNVILNSTCEISLCFRCIWYFFSNNQLFLKIIKIFLFKYWLKIWAISSLNNAKDFNLVVALLNFLFWTVHLRQEYF